LSRSAPQAASSWIGDSNGEGYKFWLSVLTELKNRRMGDVLIVCCDGLNGLPNLNPLILSEYPHNNHLR